MNNHFNNALSSPSYFYIFIAFIAAFAGILFGYDTGVISGAILFIRDEFQLSVQMDGVVVSSVLLGALFGAMFSGRLADRYGRKRMLILDSLIFIIGTVAASLAPNVLILIIARLIVGIAIGISSYIGPLYISEISPAKSRGALVSLNQLAITVGILISYVVDFYAAHHGEWRWMFAAGVIPAALLLIGMVFLPHSPRWMLSRGEEEQAMAILKGIRGFSPVVTREFELIKASLKQQKGTWRELFSKTVRPALIIGAGLALIQQLTGINTIIYYAPTIFKIAGFKSAETAILATMGVGAFNVLMTIVSLMFIDRLGRKPLLFIGLVLMSISLFGLSWSFHVHGQSEFLRWLTFACMFIFIAGFATSLGPIVWVMIAEIFPLQVRGLGSSLATCVNWGANWLVALSFLTLVDLLTIEGVFLIFAVISVLSIVFIYLIVPETKGCSLEQIEQNLYAGKKAKELGRGPA